MTVLSIGTKKGKEESKVKMSKRREEEENRGRLQVENPECYVIALITELAVHVQAKVKVEAKATRSLRLRR